MLKISLASLEVIQITPGASEVVAVGAPDAPVSINGRDTLTVVFSHAIIPLGSDFGFANQ